jgi:acyl phosphate:glycerol-3-phosphate acyltransferase
VIGYIVGSVPFALLVARRHGVDLRRAGDGNPGAWNALELLGGRRAWPAFVGDGLKGLVAGAAGWALGAGWGPAYAGVAGAMVGHCFPVWAGFRGGKGVMTFAGGAFALSPPAAGIALAACGAVWAVRDFRWGARVAVWGFPLVQLAVDGPYRVAWTGALMCLIGLRYLGGRRPARATPVADAPPRG